MGGGGGFFLMWKNGLTDEDSNGQRFLYARSPDAKNWTVPRVFLPNITTPGHPLTLEPGPCTHARGRLYGGSIMLLLVRTRSKRMQSWPCVSGVSLRPLGRNNVKWRLAVSRK